MFGFFRLFSTGLLLAAALAACAPAATLAPTTVLPTPVVPTSIPPTLVIPTATPTSTPTLPPATPTVTRSLAPTGLPQGPEALWHLVVISDSSGRGLGEAYANQIEKDMGVKVLLEDFALPNLTAREVRNLLQSPKTQIYEFQGLTEAVKEAEVVVLAPSPMKSVDSETRGSIDSCFAASAPAPCNAQAFENYTADLEAIWAKIFELRTGQQTILRAVDDASPFVGAWNKARIYDECSACWKYGSDAMRLAAGTFHIPFISRYDAFNGLKHNEDLGQKRLVGNDNIHPNALASQMTAELLSKLGYEPVPQPPK